MEPLRPFGDIDSSGVGVEKKVGENVKKDELEPTTNGMRSNGGNSELVGAETSDEERAAYEDRRNGVGQRLVPALKAQKQRQITTVSWLERV